MPRGADGRHHPVRADGDDAVAVAAKRNRAARPARPTHRLPSPRRCCRRTRGPAAASRRSPAPRRSTRRRHRPRPRSRRPCSGRSSSCSRRSRAPSSRRARNAWPIENSTALPRPPPTSTTVSPPAISVGVPVGPISTTGSPGFSSAQRSDEPPISSTIVETRPCSRSTQAPVSARPSIARRVPSTTRRQRLEILQPVELARLGSAAPPPAHARPPRRSSASGARRARRSRAARRSGGRGTRRRLRPSRGATWPEHAARRSDSPAWRCAIAFTTLPRNDGCRSPKKLVARPSARMPVSTAGSSGLARPLTGCHRIALLVQQPEILAVELRSARASSRASTVLGCVPAATRMRPRRQRHVVPNSCQTPSPSL